jgi:dipeptidyl aminopeptidase/acylaminoacyl peptidase
VSDSSPQVSPDGQHVAFVRADADGIPQIFVIPASGGEPVQATEARGGVGSFAWSPDGGRIAFTARVPEQGRYGTVEGRSAEAESPRRITGVRWHANGLGYIADRPSHLFIVDVPDTGAEPFYAPAPTAGRGRQAPRVAAEAMALTAGAVRITASCSRPTALTADGRRRDRRRSPRSADAARRRGRRRLGHDRGARSRRGYSVDDVSVARRHGRRPGVATGESGIDFIAPDVALYVLEGPLSAPARARSPTPTPSTSAKWAPTSRRSEMISSSRTAPADAWNCCV